ncbi:MULTISPECIES: TrbC/VirB2 family protein [Burkholderiaceae]|uniref:TrbC/VirB2 family protein n=1 Tax=Burkholderiaceae TaxID=119060 RepID=UPI000960FFB8|nr:MULTISPECIES: TrbC/VirB2 family protein [Burkholderiaceae]MCG1040519.1 TrbC/VirB2 family protein [Mycetohabitans sp. B7]SIT64935.1 TrbC/VIRB2 family protein [Burkholderia sp. b14]
MTVMQVISARDSNAQRWLKTLIEVGIVMTLMMLVSSVYASDGTEFAAAVTKWEQWVKGNLGKLAALIAIGVGSVMAAVKKDWSWFFGAVVLSMGVGVLVGIVNKSFTAII